MLKRNGFHWVIASALLFALLLAACAAPAAPAAAPAGEGAAQEAAATEAEAAAPAAEATTEAAEAAPADQEAPPVEPAAQAGEATPLPAEASAGASRTFALSPDKTTAQYAVEEEFLGMPVPFVTAIGKTSAVEGQLTLNFADGGVTFGDNQFTADLRTLTSDRPRRDNAIRDRWLESNQYPLATFVGTEVSDLPADADFGKDVTFKISGDMTIREVTKPQTWSMTAQLDGENLSGQAQTFLLMRDFGFEPPDIAGMLKVTDGVTVTLDFVAQEVK
ncbi:MAG: YceI family protein [Anaerolineales bacterium]|nr:YceI family protein [Anaerolineales bacterium]